MPFLTDLTRYWYKWTLHPQHKNGTDIHENQRVFIWNIINMPWAWAGSFEIIEGKLRKGLSPIYAL